MPGRGADGTGFRDTVLCAQELRDVDSVLALLSAKNVGESRSSVDDLLRIWGPGAKDRLLAVVSRFDQLSHDQNVSAGRRDALAGGDGPLTAAELLGAIPTLDSVYKAALRTVMDHDPERVCFVSAMGYLSERLQAEERGLRGLADKFYEKELGFPPTLNQEHQRWCQEMGKWVPVAERLSHAGDSASRTMGSMLRDFSEDGGFSRLFRVLKDHLARHGQSNKLERLLVAHGQLLPLVQKLETAASEAEARAAAAEAESASAAGGVPAAEGPTAPSRDEIVRALAQAYQSLQAYAKSRPRSYSLIEPDPEKLLATREILPLLRRGLVGDIMRWKQWRLLLSRVGRTEPGLVDLVDPNAPPNSRVARSSGRKRPAPPSRATTSCPLFSSRWPRPGVSCDGGPCWHGRATPMS